MKRLLCLLLVGLCTPALLCGCGRSRTDETITNMHIPIGDVTEFCYTYENINFNASYRRYRLYMEDGRCLFHHEAREKPNGYGWTTEEDITAAGTFELTDAEWREAVELLKNGKVSRRSDSAETGSSGPWTYIYWKRDKSRYQQFEFSAYGEKLAFEEYCAALAGRDQ